MMSFFSKLFGLDNKTQQIGGNDMLKIGIVLGSTREGRVSPQVGEWVKELADKRGDAEYKIIDIAEFKLPLLGEAGGDASGAAAWSAQINGCDGFVFITQEYNHSITGALKNALDYLRDEWNNKAAGIVSYGSVGGARATEHLRGILSELSVAHVRVHPALSLFTDFENGSDFKPKDVQADSVNQMLDQVISWSTALKTVRK
jgi:NAD(P)H-dependent FMN reductase